MNAQSKVLSASNFRLPCVHICGLWLDSDRTNSTSNSMANRALITKWRIFKSLEAIKGFETHTKHASWISTTDINVTQTHLKKIITNTAPEMYIQQGDKLTSIYPALFISLDNIIKYSTGYFDIHLGLFHTLHKAMLVTFLWSLHNFYKHSQSHKMQHWIVYLPQKYCTGDFPWTTSQSR